MPGLILYSGALAQQPGQGGLTWLHLQFILGLRRLGWDVLFIDRLEPGMCIDEHGRPAGMEDSENVRYFLRVMRAFDIAPTAPPSRLIGAVGDRETGHSSFSLICPAGQAICGATRGELLDRAQEATLLLNVMGYLNDSEILGRVRRRVFVDIDPGFGQMWRELGLHDPFRGHDDFVTLGRNIGRPDCAIPTCGLAWITMPQPVVLDEWPALVHPQTESCPAAFTSIGAWRGPNAAVEYNGHSYGLRVHEFRKFMHLPSLCPESQFEMAFDIHSGDEQDIRRLQQERWALVDPKRVANGPWKFRDYIARSKAEFMVPKQMYVDTNSGLLSDRSTYYLATGRPVLARDTGIRRLYPTGEGLLTFATLDEAAAGVREIDRNYARHSEAARAIAVEHFNSDKVLTTLLRDLGVQSSLRPTA